VNDPAVVDSISPAARSANMAVIRPAGMAPERMVRSLVHKMGYRFRLHGKDLPGKPDLVFPSRKKVIFVHGCFWRRHGVKPCRIWRAPKSNLAYWRPKLDGNKLRDKANMADLKKMGWGALVIWECQMGDMGAMERKIRKFLN
jgi:DNA mismatch endonuclease (patch repair protein)